MKRRKPSPGGIDRRTLFQYGASGGAVAALGAAVPRAAAAAPESPAAARPAAFELDEISIAELQKRMQSGAETSRSITEKYRSRIDALDRRGPELRSVIETNPDALSIADALDAERKAGRVRGPLHGIPILVKDNIGTADRMTTTAGSLALEGSIHPADSFVAKRLRESGAVLLGKTNLSEWANFRSTHSTSGWSGRGGQCRNPYALDRNPSGSSSGSGTAAAASLCAAAVGSETDGSIVSPSNNCALVGIKPTLGLVSRTGIIPIAHSQDTAGPMARTVADAAALLSGLAGVDPSDGITKESSGHSHADYTKFLQAGILSGLRIGVPRKGLFGQSAHADRARRGRDRGSEEARRRDRRPGRHRHGGGDRQDGVRSPALRVQGGPERVSRESAGVTRPLPDARGLDRLQRQEPRPRDAVLRAGDLPPGGEERAVDRKGVPRCAREGPAPLPQGGHRQDDGQAPPRRAGLADLRARVPHRPRRRRLRRRAAAPLFRPWPGTRTSRCPRGTRSVCRSGFPSIGRAWSEPVLIRIAYAYEQATKHRKAPGFAASATV